MEFRSGIKSHVYTSFRNEITDRPAVELLVGKKVAEVVAAHTLPEDKQPCLIGIPTVGSVLAQAAAAASELWGVLAHTALGEIHICHRTMREQRKDYGIHQGWVNGDPNPSQHTYWLLDNVVADGKSKLDARDRLTESGYPAKSMPSLVLVDLHRGGVRNMEMWGFSRITVVYNILDICYALVQLGLWEPAQFIALEYEITMGKVL